ncbi:hypothetical protein OSH11_23690 [Kaistia dalseonensis]|uniref:ElaB/YqjD/DUF883 family membrane-anchored ribosome-binding protein n=1 Tax=Kaistia dalseonensis TaxID=410840 RepID=A0ABU0HFR6_9HYPH|nr:hypothetical protein [Kaistia dalseonensis]MCX5497722.1 hypothetical protein [Kaistia dalseonensis]MDQ0440366.1 ElaB/YqjD/DUF883 family membrane-anchored ribosome-binding protein [Kaistia dalseonensis]
MSGKTTDGLDLSEQVKAIQAELLGLTETIRSFTSQKAEAGADAFRDAAHAASETVRSSAEDARRRGEHLAEDIEGRITANPVPSVLIAAGIGLVIGALIGRR